MVTSCRANGFNYYIIAEKSFIHLNEKYRLSTHFHWMSLLLWLVGFTLFSGFYVITHRYKCLSREKQYFTSSYVYFYLQKYYSCRRGSVAGLNFNFVGICFTSSVAYLTFNVSLFWIPQVQVLNHLLNKMICGNFFKISTPGGIFQETSRGSESSATEWRCLFN